MADEFVTRTPPSPARRGGIGGKGLLLIGLLAFALGGGAVGYAAWQGLLPTATQTPDRLLSAPAAPAPLAAASASPSAAAAAMPAQEIQQDAFGLRITALEQRLNQLDLRAQAASGNAARAEGLLVAFAARRALDRGAPLGFLADQLRLRFADAQPNAVKTVVEAAARPVTLDQLIGGLDALAPALGQGPKDEGAWQQVKREFANLFVIRHDTGDSSIPQDRIARARQFLLAGRIDQAVAEVRALPGAQGAGEWIASAQRYGAARDALDLIETTALLDTAELKDGKGQTVDQPSPAIKPAPASGTSATF